MGWRGGTVEIRAERMLVALVKSLLPGSERLHRLIEGLLGDGVKPGGVVKISLHGDRVAVEYRVKDLVGYIMGYERLHLAFANLGGPGREGSCLAYTGYNMFNLLSLTPPAVRELAGQEYNIWRFEL